VNPVPPFVSEPVRGKEYRATAVKFRWLKVPDAVAYDLQVAADPDFSTIVWRREALSETACILEGIPFATYYYRIRSVAGDGFRGVWSDGVPFAMSPPPPAPPTEAPEVGDDRITIRWRDQGPGMTYHFQVADDPDFRVLRVDEKLERSEFTLDKPKSPGRYYTRVRSIDTEGFEGRFSNPQSFEVKRDPKEAWAVALAVGTILIILFP
jgi:hypothetical protein